MFMKSTNDIGGLRDPELGSNLSRIQVSFVNRSSFDLQGCFSWHYLSLSLDGQFREEGSFSFSARWSTNSAHLSDCLLVPAFHQQSHLSHDARGSVGYPVDRK